MSLNTRSGLYGRLESALRALWQVNFIIGVIQEINLTEGVYTRHSTVYSIYATETEIRHRGRITITCWQEEGWQPEGVVNYSQNLLSFIITSRWRRWYVVGEYVPTNYHTMVQ